MPRVLIAALVALPLAAITFLSQPASAAVGRGPVVIGGPSYVAQARRPERHRVWVAGHWNRTAHGRVWVPGHYEYR